jgi:preprotein translocase subunit SecG
MDPEELRANVKKAAIIGSFFALALLLYALHWRGALVAYAILVGILATLAILIQSGKGGGLAASFGGMGADSLLGTHSATPIAKATYVMLGLCLFILALAARLGPAAVGAEGLGPAGGAPMDLPIPGLPEPAPAPESTLPAAAAPTSTSAPQSTPTGAAAPTSAPASPAAPSEAPSPVEPVAND